MFLEEPQEVCTNRASLGTQDDSIAITLKQPHENGKIAQTFSVWYDISAGAPITKVRVMLDNQDIGDFAYAGSSSTRVSDIKKVSALSPVQGGSHTLTIIATDNAGRYNKKTVTVQ